MKRIFSKNYWVLSVLLISVFIISACGTETSISEGEIPELEATSTTLPHVTATPYPVSSIDDPAEVDWNDPTDHYKAMRADYASDIDDWMDGNRYYVEATIDLNSTATVITGAQRNIYVNRSEDTLTEVVFKLNANLPRMSSRMRIPEVQVEGEVVDFILEELQTVLRVPLTEPLAPGEQVETVVKFVTVMERGIVGSYGQSGYRNDLFVLPGWNPTLSVYRTDGSGWWTERPTPQGDELFSETALYEHYLTRGENVNIAMSGITIEEIDNGDGTVTEHVVSGPMRYSMLAASPTIGKITDEVEGTTVNVYYLPGDERAAQWGMDVTLDSFRAFNKDFGDYPYAEFDLLETYTFAGIEYPGIVVILESSWTNGSVWMEAVTAHEVAHQWWYGIIGNDQVNHPWIDESLTSYSEVVYYRNAYDDGEQRANEDVQSNRSNYNFWRGQTGSVDLPMNLPAGAYASNQYGVLIYTKGTVFYDELERLIGRDAFLEGIQSYFEDNKYENVTSYDILVAMEEASGQDLDEFFYTWIGDFDGLDPEAKARVDEENAREEE